MIIQLDGFVFQKYEKKNEEIRIIMSEIYIGRSRFLSLL